MPHVLPSTCLLAFCATSRTLTVCLACRPKARTVRRNAQVRAAYAKELDERAAECESVRARASEMQLGAPHMLVTASNARQST